MTTDPLLTRALAVLAKADSTNFGEERSALVYGGYVLLARYLAANPAPPGPEGRRRERRLVSDRRRRAERATTRSRPEATAVYRPESAAPPVPGGVLDARI